MARVVTVRLEQVAKHVERPIGCRGIGAEGNSDAVRHQFRRRAPTVNRHQCTGIVCDLGTGSFQDCAVALSQVYAMGKQRSLVKEAEAHVIGGDGPVAVSILYQEAFSFPRTISDLACNSVYRFIAQFLLIEYRQGKDDL
ncbi:hypothetical protein D9M72_517200 [compost metagenome]